MWLLTSPLRFRVVHIEDVFVVGKVTYVEDPFFYMTFVKVCVACFCLCFFVLVDDSDVYFWCT